MGEGNNSDRDVERVTAGVESGEGNSRVRGGEGNNRDMGMERITTGVGGGEGNSRGRGWRR